MAGVRTPGRAGGPARDEGVCPASQVSGNGTRVVLQSAVSVTGLQGHIERAPLALDEIVRLREDIARLHLHFTMGVTGADM